MADTTAEQITAPSPTGPTGPGSAPGLLSALRRRATWILLGSGWLLTVGAYLAHVAVVLPWSSWSRSPACCAAAGPCSTG